MKLSTPDRIEYPTRAMMGRYVNSKASTNPMLKSTDARARYVEPCSTGMNQVKSMNKAELELANTLKRHEVYVQNHNQIRLNSGSETAKHVVAKALVAQIASEQSWRVSSEVSVPDGDIDVLLHKTPQERVWAVELETNPTEEVTQSKLNRYVKQTTGIDDIVIINISQMPVEIPHAKQYLQEELPL